ncbi:MAG: hypothetical protein R3E64_08825 [Halioglobus sp.]
MRGDLARERYLQRHIEAGLPAYSFSAPHWHNVLVLPAYREAPDLLQRLTAVPAGSGTTLLILVLNRPDSDPDPLANALLRTALDKHSANLVARSGVPVLRLNTHTDLYLLDMETLYGPNPANCGVGLARKAGCDLALLWMNAGGISGKWLCSTDADATLPADYFHRLEDVATSAAAAVFPFRHTPAGDSVCDHATALYELRLHHYVLGLEYARSPYAYHTLGSALAITASAYAQVRGFPKRAGAEDFYVLNKLAKVGPIARLQGRSIELQSRRSARVPFGTGPAVDSIMTNTQIDDAALFYHPVCYQALRAVLAVIPALAQSPVTAIAQQCVAQDLPPDLAQQIQSVLTAMDIAAALQHCRQHGKSSAQFQRQFHQWFDGFRTLKFIHALRDAGWSQLSLQQLNALQPMLWPSDHADITGIEGLCNSVRHHWGWR